MTRVTDRGTQGRQTRANWRDKCKIQIRPGMHISGLLPRDITLPQVNSTSTVFTLITLIHYRPTRFCSAGSSLLWWGSPEFQQKQLNSGRQHPKQTPWLLNFFP